MKICRLTPSQLLACARILSAVESVIERETTLAYQEGKTYAEQRAHLSELQAVLLKTDDTQQQAILHNRQAFIAATDKLMTIGSQREQQIQERTELETTIIDVFCELLS